MGEESNAGVVVLRSPRLVAAGVRHGFSTRVGGVSVEPFASMNLARAVGDDLDAVAENHRRFAAAVGYAADRLHESSQVHGAAVVSVRGPDVLATRTLSADALVATEPGDAVAVRVADCVPVLLAVPGRGVAAVHAGWRGVVAGVVGAALDVLGGATEDVLAAIGPCIGACCFEVGPEVADAIAAVSAPAVVHPREGANPHVDLRAAVAWQLAARGVDAVDQVGGCTRCDAARFHSFRRDGKRSGRLLAAIVA